jgi:hypothetical protein
VNKQDLKSMQAPAAAAVAAATLLPLEWERIAKQVKAAARRQQQQHCTALIVHPRFPNGMRHFWDKHQMPEVGVDCAPRTRTVACAPRC